MLQFSKVKMEIRYYISETYCPTYANLKRQVLKDLHLKKLKVVPLFIRIMTPNGAIWSLDQRTMR